MTDLDRRMLNALHQLVRCSHVPAARERTAASSEALGGNRPPGDLGHEEYARRYGPPFHICTFGCDHRPCAPNDNERLRVIEDAEREIAQIRGTTPAKERPLESETQLAARIVREGEGWTVDQCSVHFRCLKRTVILARERDGRDRDLGHEEVIRWRTPEERRRYACELAEKGLKLRQIARRLGSHHMTISRDLREVA